MSAAATKTKYTPEDLFGMPDGDRYELANGQLVEHSRSLLASYIAGTLQWLLHTFCRENQPGWVLPDGTTYQCFADDPDKVRKADVSFIGLARLSIEQALAKGHVRIPPDLAAEVIPPNDLYYEVEAKAEEWLSAGAQIVWIVNPRTRSITVRRADATISLLQENDDLTGEKILPGFRCRVGELFVLPTQTAPTA